METLLEDSRDLACFQLLVEEYVRTGKAVSSKKLAQLYAKLTNIQLSSALMRIILTRIAKCGLIEKGYQTSGRIPTTQGCRYYSQIVHPNLENIYEQKLMEIFLNRRSNIFKTIDTAVEVMSQTINMAVIATTDSSAETLKSIRMTPVSDTSGVIVIVTSFARSESKVFQLEDSSLKLEDIRVAIRLFNERLLDVPLIDLVERARALQDILRAQVVNYEALFEKFIQNVLNFKPKSLSKIYNQESIILADNIPRHEVVRLLKLAENSSIWEMIENKLEEDETIKLQVLNSKDVALISKKFSEVPYIKEISVIASKRMDQEHSLRAVSVLGNLIKNYTLSETALSANKKHENS